MLMKTLSFILIGIFACFICIQYAFAEPTDTEAEYADVDDDADISGNVNLVQEGLTQEAPIHGLFHTEGGLLDHEPGSGVAGLHLQGVLVCQHPDEEQHQSRSQQVQSSTADGLVSPEVDGGKGQKQGEHSAHNRCYHHCQQLQTLERKPVTFPGGGGEYLQVLHAVNKQHADEGTENHNTFQGQVDDTAAFSEYTGQSHNHKRNRIQ